MSRTPAIRTELQHRTLHKVTIDEADIHRLLVDAIAAEIGVNVADASVSVRAYSTSHQDGSLGVSKPRINIEIVVDHSATQVKP